MIVNLPGGQQVDISQELTADTLKFFGRKIKGLRLERNFSQEDLAEKTGVTLKELARIENGQWFPPVWILNNFSLVLDIHIIDLFPWEDYNFSLDGRLLADQLMQLEPDLRQTILTYLVVQVRMAAIIDLEALKDWFFRKGSELQERHHPSMPDSVTVYCPWPQRLSREIDPLRAAILELGDDLDSDAAVSEELAQYDESFPIEPWEKELSGLIEKLKRLEPTHRFSLIRSFQGIVDVAIKPEAVTIN